VDFAERDQDMCADVDGIIGSMMPRERMRMETKVAGAPIRRSSGVPWM